VVGEAVEASKAKQIVAWRIFICSLIIILNHRSEDAAAAAAIMSASAPA
jgi:hypothetical protein